MRSQPEKPPSTRRQREQCAASVPKPQTRAAYELRCTGDHNYALSQAKLRRVCIKEETTHQATFWHNLPVEIIYLIIQRCDAVDILNLSETCRKLYHACANCQIEWKTLCAVDFDVHLRYRRKFPSYREIYRLLYCSRILTGSYIYGRYYSKVKIGNIPSWLLIWALLSRDPPIMKYGRHRIKRHITGRYLRRLQHISYGQIRKVFNDNFFDLLKIKPISISAMRGTVYFTWKAIKLAEIRKYGSELEYQNFLLDRCYRSRGFIERNYKRVLGSDPLESL